MGPPRLARRLNRRLDDSLLSSWPAFPSTFPSAFPSSLPSPPPPSCPHRGRVVVPGRLFALPATGGCWKGGPRTGPARAGWRRAADHPHRWPAHPGSKAVAARQLSDTARQACGHGALGHRHRCVHVAAVPRPGRASLSVALPAWRADRPGFQLDGLCRRCRDPEGGQSSPCPGPVRQDTRTGQAWPDRLAPRTGPDRQPSRRTR